MRRCSHGGRSCCSAWLQPGWRSDSLALRRKRGARRRLQSEVLAFCGRHSLAFYLIHQPVLFGLFTALSLVAAPPPDANAFRRECAVNCVNQGVEAGVCEKSCDCLMEHAKAQGFWLAMARNEMTPSQKGQAHDEAVACYADAAGK